MIQVVRGTLALTTDGSTSYTGSMELGGSVSLRVSLTPIVIPADPFEVNLQVEQTLDSLAFADVGGVVRLDSATPVQQEIEGIGASIVRARISFTSPSGDPAVIAVEILPVPNTADREPRLALPVFQGLPARDLLPAFTWQFALAANRGRALRVQPLMPGLVPAEPA